MTMTHLVIFLKTSARVCGRAYLGTSEVLVVIKMVQVKVFMVRYKKNKI